MADGMRGDMADGMRGDMAGAETPGPGVCTNRVEQLALWLLSREPVWQEGEVVTILGRPWLVVDVQEYEDSVGPSFEVLLEVPDGRVDGDSRFVDRDPGVAQTDGDRAGGGWLADVADGGGGVFGAAV